MSVTKGSSSPPQFFVEQKRGEVSELRQLLRAVVPDRDVKKRRDALKKVVAYMTYGIDVSGLFNEVLMTAGTKDVLQKKLAYLYLSSHAESSPDTAILSINTLTTDACDDDATLRGLALRSLLSYRVPAVLEHTESALRRGLTDPSAYVRRTAVLGVAKVRLFHKKRITKQTIDSLYAALNSSDPTIAINGLYALNEVTRTKGGWNLTHSHVVKLINMLNRFPSMHQASILTVISSYRPRTAEEKFDLMNIIEECLKNISPSVAMAAVKCFINFTIEDPDLYIQVIEDAKDPILTILGSSTHEMNYIVYRQIQIMISQHPDAPRCFSGHLRYFIPHEEDPPYIRKEKLELLVLMVNERTAYQIVEEMLCLAKSDPSVLLTLSKIVNKSPNVVSYISSKIIPFLDRKNHRLLGPTLQLVVGILSNNPSEISTYASHVRSVIARDTPEDCRKSIIWIIGEFSDAFPEGPYILQSLVNDSAPSGCEMSLILSSVLKMFTKRAPEVGDLLKTILMNIFQDYSYELQGRAAFYIHLLRTHTLDQIASILITHNIPQDPINEVEEERKQDFAAFGFISSALSEHGSEKPLFFKPNFVETVGDLSEMLLEDKEPEAEPEEEEEEEAEEAEDAEEEEEEEDHHAEARSEETEGLLASEILDDTPQSHSLEEEYTLEE